ncbi:MAG: flippase [Candidatus Falkowbacteria bacterium]
MSLTKKVAQNTFIQIFGKIISTILGLLALAVMTRYLGAAGFGEYTTIFTFISFFAIISDLGLTLVTVQMISDPNADEGKILNNLLALRLLSALIFLGLGPIIVLFFPYEQSIKLGVLITAISFLFVALNQIMTGIFQKRLTMNKSVWAEVISRVALLIGIVLIAYFKGSLMAILWASVLSSAISFGIQFYFSREFISLKLEYDKKVWGEIIRKSWPLAITIAFNLIYLKADTLILSLMKSPTEVGIYGSVYKIIDVLVTVPFMFAGVVLPILTADWLKKNNERFQKVWQRSLDFMILMAFPLIIGTQFVAKDIMVLIAGPEFAEAGPILQILILAAAIIFISCIFSHVIIAVNKQKKIIGAYIFTSITALAGYLIFIPKYSYLGAAWTTIYSELVILLFAAYYAKKYTAVSLNLKIVWKALLASLIMGVAMYLLPGSFYTNKLGLLVIITIAAVTYGLALLVLKAINKDDLKLILPKSTKPNTTVLEINN